MSRLSDSQYYMIDVVVDDETLRKIFKENNSQDRYLSKEELFDLLKKHSKKFLPETRKFLFWKSFRTKRPGSWGSYGATLRGLLSDSKSYIDDRVCTRIQKQIFYFEWNQRQELRRLQQCPFSSIKVTKLLAKYPWLKEEQMP